MCDALMTEGCGGAGAAAGGEHCGFCGQRRGGGGGVRERQRGLTGGQRGRPPGRRRARVHPLRPQRPRGAGEMRLPPLPRRVRPDAHH
jgi:hypothetical protein